MFLSHISVSLPCSPPLFLPSHLLKSISMSLCEGFKKKHDTLRELIPLKVEAWNLHSSLRVWASEKVLLKTACIQKGTV